VTAASTVIITGGSSGIGAALTRRLLSDGYCVVATGRDEGRLSSLAKGTGADDRLATVVADASSWAETQRVVQTCVSRFGRIDAVVANAGYTTPGDLRTGDPESWPAMVLTNVLGPALLVRAALGELEQSGGRAVIVGSVAGHKNSPGNLYGAAKWGVTGLAENLRMALTSSGVGVTLISPGVVDTAFYPEGAPETNLAPDDVAATIAWVLRQPTGVDINTLVVRPVGQAI
jgi:NADP-dependent 3-hydroxy acid dehydrogenase YdfG